MKFKAAMLIPMLTLVGAVTLPACQTPSTPAKTAANMGDNCFACHGPEGKSPGSIPSLNGKSAEAIVKTMNDFKSGARPSTVMGRHAKGYSDAETAAIAKYISSFK